MPGDHPIFDGPFSSKDVIPRTIDLGGHQFEVTLHWKHEEKYYVGDISGWIASATLNGKTYVGSRGSKLDSTMDLARQLKIELNLKTNEMTTQIPLTKRALHSLMTDKGR